MEQFYFRESFLSSSGSAEGCGQAVKVSLSLQASCGGKI